MCLNSNVKHIYRFAAVVYDGNYVNVGMFKKSEKLKCFG